MTTKKNTGKGSAKGAGKRKAGATGNVTRLEARRGPAAGVKTGNGRKTGNKTAEVFQTHNAMEMTMTKNKEQFEKLSNDAAAAGKEGLDALLKSGSVFAKGYEDMFKACFGLAQKTAEKNGEALKTLLTCKTVNEVVELNSRIAQENFDDLMTGVTRLSELSVKLAADGFAPINDQLTKTIRKAGEAMAA